MHRAPYGGFYTSNRRHGRRGGCSAGRSWRDSQGSRVGGQVMGGFEIDGQLAAAVKERAQPAVLLAGYGRNHLFGRPLAGIDTTAPMDHRDGPAGGSG